MSKGVTRRDFLKTAGTVGTGSLLAATGAFAQTTEAKPEELKVSTRPFGKTGVQVSLLSLGGMFDIRSNHLMLKQCLKWGVTYWDTADCYEGGNSEIGIGQFFKKYPETRKEVFLVTKSDSRKPDGMTKLLDQSLERLNTSTIDLYFLHGIRGIDEVTDQTKAWAEKAKADGKIRFFGFSTHSNMEECMLGAAKLGWIDGIMMTYNFRLMHTEKMKAAVEACARAGIGLTAMKTQGGGSVSEESDAELDMAGRFLTMGFTDKQAKLKAVWENPHIASICSQMPNMNILMANIAAAVNKTRLAAADREFMERYARETASAYCAGCSELCESAVTAPIATIMRYLMYYHSYGDCERARGLFAEIPAATRAQLLSFDYTPAERRCPQGLPIGRLVKEAATVLA